MYLYIVFLNEECDVFSFKINNLQVQLFSKVQIFNLEELFLL